MDDGSSFFVAIILCAVFFVLGPTVRGVDADMWHRAEVACKQNGGVQDVELVTFYNRYEVVCNNGMSTHLSWSEG